MKLKKCQENQIFQKIVAVQCLQIKVRTANFQIQHQTNLFKLIIKKITKMIKKEKQRKKK